MRTHPLAASSLAVSALLTAATLASPAAQAADSDSKPTKFTQSARVARSPSYTLDIPAGDLNSALQELALASHHKLFYKAELVEGKTAPALKGEYTAEQAVEKLLSGTNLVWEITPS